jgi:hypothetical protein
MGIAPRMVAVVSAGGTGREKRWMVLGGRRNNSLN